MAKYIVSNILWSRNAEKSLNLILPDEILVNSEYLDVESDEDFDVVYDAISEYLIDEYKCGHYGFDCEQIGL